MKLSRLTFILFVFFTAAASYAYSLDGAFSTSYEVSKDQGHKEEGVWENYLRLDDVALYNPYVNFNFYGRFAHNDGTGDSYTDLYSAYLDLSSFQKAVDVKIGRFDYIDNKFLTLDGAMATVRTDYKLGMTVFAGAPQFFDEDDRHINETFRHTGDKLYGGKLFLNGVKDTTGYVSYSREMDGSEELQELLGLGLGHQFTLSGDTTLSADGKMEYDTDTKQVYRGIGRVYLKKDKLSLIGDFTRYNVKDGTDYSDELIISNFATGKEEKYALTAQYAVTDNISPYASIVRTQMEIASGAIADGSIYKLGTELNYFREKGVTSAIEGYYYNSEISNAKGVSLNVNWDITKKFRTALETEAMKLENTTTDKVVTSIYLKGEYDVTKDLTVSVYGENNRETRYLPENRIGAKAAYSF